MNSHKSQMVSVTLQVFERQTPNSQTMTRAYSLLGIDAVEPLV